MPPKGRAGTGSGSPSKDGARPQSTSIDVDSPGGKVGSPLLPQAAGGTLNQPGRRGTLRGSVAMLDGSTYSREELAQKHLEMQERFETLQPTNARLVKDLKKKKESYVRREVFYKSQISNIKEVLEKTVLCRGGNESSMPSIRRMHSQASARFFVSSQAIGNTSCNDD